MIYYNKNYLFEHSINIPFSFPYLIENMDSI